MASQFLKNQVAQSTQPENAGLASSFLRERAAVSQKRTDKTFGNTAYGGSKFQFNIKPPEKKVDALTKILLSAAPPKNPLYAQRPKDNAFAARAYDNQRKYPLLAANTPNFDPGAVENNGRNLNVLSGAGKTYGASLVNGGGFLLDTTSFVNRRAGDYEGKIEAAEDNISRYQAQRQTADAMEQKRLDTLIERNRRVIALENQSAQRDSQYTTGAAKKLYGTADRLDASGRRDIAKAKDTTGKFGDVAIDIGVAGAQLAGDATVAALLGVPALVPMGARVFGGATQTARQNGASFGEQAAYGASSAALSVATERLLNISAPFRKMFGKGFLDDVVTNVTGKLGQSPAGKLALSALSEGGEEFLEDALQPILQRATYDPSAKFDLNNALYDALIGGVLGGIGGSADVLSGIGNTVTASAGRGAGAETANTVNPDTVTPDVNVPQSGGKAPPTELLQIMTDSVDKMKKPASEMETESDALNNAALSDAQSASMTLRNHLSEIRNMESVAELTGNEIPGTGRATERVISFLASIGNKVVRPNFGEVLFSKAKIKNSLLGHGFGESKVELFASVPNVIQYGKQIGFKANWKNRGYDSYLFAAPVNYRGNQAFVTVIVIRDNANRYYLHEAVDSDGNLIYGQEKSPDSASDRSAKNNPQNTVAGTELFTERGVGPVANAERVNIDRGTTTLSENTVSQAIGKSKGDGTDALTKILLGGKRVDQSTLTPEQFDHAATLNEAGRVGMDAGGRVFNADPAQHIDHRTTENVAPRRVKAFQFDWPEVHPYYAQAAADLLADADLSLRNGNNVRYERTMQGNKRISTIAESPFMREAMDGGLSRSEIIRAAQAIVDDHGQENFAAAKRLELVLDRMLTYGYTTLYDKTVEASPAYLEAKARISGAEEQVEETGEELPIWDMGTDGIGAADAGFDPYSAAMNEYGTIEEGEHPARTIDTPKRMEPDTKVSLTARTVQEAEATPEKRLQTIQDAIVGGTLSYIPVSNAEATQRAEDTIGRDGWSKALNDWTADARAGRASEDLTAMGATLLNNMGNSDATGEQYVDLLYDYTAMLRSAGQAVQAARILKRLTPEGRLYCVQKTVNRINEGTRDAGKAPSVKLGGEELGIIDQAREDALQLIREIAEIFSEPHKRKHGVPVEDWVAKIGKQLEQNLSERLNPKKPNAQPISKTILNDLVQFAEERALPKQAAVKKSAADRLYNFFNNRAAYAEAWSTAQTALRAKYRGNPAALAAFDKWLATSPEQMYGEKAMRDAVLEAIVTQDTDVKQIVGRMQLGDESSVLNEIYQTVAQRIQPDAADARAIKNAIAKALVTISYGKPSTNTDALVRAKLKEMGEKMSGIIREGGKSKEDVAKIISNLLISEYNISTDAAGSVSKNIVDSFNRQVAEASQKALQARFGKRLPPHRKSQLEKFEELGNLGAFSSDRFNAHATNLVFQTEGVRLSPDLAKHYLDAKTDAERNKVMEEIQQNIADQLPATKMEKFTALRYLFMLGNLKTQVRNVVGNVVMQPVRMVKDRIGAGLEAVASQLSGGKVQRTKSFVASPAMYKEAWGDFETVRKEALGSGKYQDGTMGQLDRDIEEKRRIFNWKIFEAPRKLTNLAMEKGDVGFSRFTYADALAGFLQARGAKNIAGTDPALLDSARNYAIRQAQQATYRDNNAFSDMIADMRFRRPGNNIAKRVANVAGEGLLPFRRGTANILVRAEEYSPLGLINTTVQAVQAKRGKATGADVIESLSKTLTGSVICALGAWLFLEGYLRGSDDEDKKQANFDRLLGHQAYSLELPGGQSYTLDWLAPASMPFFVGAQVAEAMGSEGLTFKELLSILGAISDPMLQMSMMQGVNDALSHLSYADEAALPTLVTNSLVNYMTQGMTSTLFGQLERVTEENRMTTYVDENGKLPDSWQRALGKASAKIPGWDFQQMEYIDAWGRTEDSGDPALRTFNNLFNPAYVSKVSVDAVERELQRIRDKTGDTSVFPSNAARYFNVGEQRKDLTMEEYTKYAKALGQTRYDLASEGMKLSVYKGMNDSEKSEYIQRLYDYANATAKTTISAYTPEDWVQNAKTAKQDIGISTAEFLALYQQYGGGVLSSNAYEKTKRAVNAGLSVEQYAGLKGRLDGDGNGSISKSEAISALDGSGFPAGQKADIWDIIHYKNWGKKNPYA